MNTQLILDEILRNLNLTNVMIVAADPCQQRISPYCLSRGFAEIPDTD